MFVQYVTNVYMVWRWGRMEEDKSYYDDDYGYDDLDYEL